MNRSMIASIVIVGATASLETLAQDPSGATPANLIRAVMANESKIDQLKSFRVRCQWILHRSAESIKEARASLEKRYGPDLDPRRHRDLWPETKGSFELAFDDSRIRHVRQTEGSDFNIQIQDGKRFLTYRKDLINKQEYSGLKPQEKRTAFHTAFAFWSVPRVASHSLWWCSMPTEFQNRLLGRVEDYIELPRENFQGVECHILENRSVGRRLQIAVADGRLRGLLLLPNATSIEESLRSQPMEVERWRPKRRLNLSTNKSLTAKEKREIVYDQRILPTYMQLTMDQYKELAPGFWYPMANGSEGYSLDAQGAKQSQFDRRSTVVEIAVNEALPDNLFQFTPSKGVAKP